ncbi:hypothetical protein CEXT_578891 [Caerostris extrusa]|uniref:Uncharacterized protein n=1 Tax=Caerostris extrusa TaxID=172846 RepID=A0AAV4N9P7_CAEEX|nr:hypothetical protein CEXT_578891 [Caerostris extrusa]
MNDPSQEKLRGDTMAAAESSITAINKSALLPLKLWHNTLRSNLIMDMSPRLSNSDCANDNGNYVDSRAA